MSKKSFLEEKEKAEEIYGEIIPHLVAIQEVLVKHGIEDGKISSFSIDPDGYINARVEGSLFYAYRMGDDDFTLTCNYAESLGDKSA